MLRDSNMRCAIYARYSSDLQNARSIEDQIRNCRQFAERSGWTVLDGHIYSDRAVSGMTMVGRSGLSELMRIASAKPKPFDYVLIDDTSRLSREKIEQAEMVRDLRDSGIFIYFVSDNMDTRDETVEDVILPIYGIKDSLYCKDLANRTKRGMIGQVLKGFNPGGRTYGYKYTPVLDPDGEIDRKTRQIKSLGTKIEVNPEQSKVVRTIFSMYASGFGLRAITLKLNEQDIEPPGKERQLRKGIVAPSWCPNAVRSILRNRKYVGDWTWNRFRWVRKRKTGKRSYVLRPEDEWVEYYNSNLAIIDNELWETVQERIEGNKHNSGHRSPRKNYLLSGLLRCGICEASLIVVKCKGGDGIGYRCSFNWHRGARVCPNNVTIRKADIENKVLSAIKDRWLNDDVVELLVEKVNAIIKKKMSSSHAEKGRLLEKRNKLSSEIHNLIKFVAESGTVSPMVQEAIKEKEARLSAVDSEISRAEQNAINKELRVKPGFVTRWLNKLELLIERDILAARAEISKLIGELTAIPTTHGGQDGLLLSGKPKIEGVLGVITGVSTLQNSGGALFHSLEEVKPIISYLRVAQSRTG